MPAAEALDESLELHGLPMFGSFRQGGMLADDYGG
jgi:hypothetical protein